MDRHIATALDRWLSAGLIDKATFDRLRDFESTQSPTQRFRWGAAIAWGFGALLIGAGIISFVAANWQEMPQPLRMALILVLTAGFHIAAGFFTHTPHLRLALHAIGTLSLGAGIALAGQIFNLDSGWNGWMLLWALGSAAGYWFLRDWPQLILMALLLPLWVTSEWSERVSTHHALPYFTLWLGLSVLYFTSNRRALVWLGGLGLVPASVVLMAVSAAREQSPHLRDWLACLVLTATFLAASRPQIDWRRAAAVLTASLLAVLASTTPGWHNYLALGLAHVALTAWGVATQRVDRVNVGIACFALTVFGFYVSHALTLLGSSLGLIFTGLLMLGGGFVLERTRRRLVGGLQ